MPYPARMVTARASAVVSGRDAVMLGLLWGIRSGRRLRHAVGRQVENSGARICERPEEAVPALGASHAGTVMDGPAFPPQGFKLPTLVLSVRLPTLSPEIARLSLHVG